MTILDSRSTGHYFLAHTPLPNCILTKKPIAVTVANQQVMRLTHTAELSLPGLPPEARKVHIFPSLGTNLVGVTPLTQAGCEVTFKGDKCTIKCPGGEDIICHATPKDYGHSNTRNANTTTINSLPSHRELLHAGRHNSAPSRCPVLPSNIHPHHSPPKRLHTTLTRTDSGPPTQIYSQSQSHSHGAYG
jgi:hypothetical protein